MVEGEGVEELENQGLNYEGRKRNMPGLVLCRQPLFNGVAKCSKLWRRGCSPTNNNIRV